MRRLLAVIFLAGALAGCGQGGDQYATAPGGAPAEMDMADGAAMNRAAVMAEESAAEAPQAAPAPGDPAQQPGPSGPAPVQFLAYTHQLSIELPAARVAPVMDAHVKACEDAGPRLCQIVGTNRWGDPETSVNGSVTLRGEPVWLQGYMNGIAGSVEAADGRMVGQNTSTEDLTRGIVDTEARLNALRALRDRLQRLIESRPGRLSDLLEVERELARVQSEIDALQSGLAVMRTRVAMSMLTLNYASSGRPLQGDTFEPLTNAFDNALRVVVWGLAAIVTAIAALLPFAALAGAVAWGILWWRKRRGGRLLPRAQSPPPPQTAPPANE